MKPLLRLLCACLLSAQLPAADPPLRTWRALGNFQTEASFLSYDAGIVRLRKTDGQEIAVRIEQLVPEDRAHVLALASPADPSPTISRPTGRRELTWNELSPADPWPPSIVASEKTALLGLNSRPWSHAETEHFVLHYQQVGFAKRVARMADFFYAYIASDLPGLPDLQKEKSHIVVIRDEEEWREFVRASGVAPDWSAAYVRGQVMFLQDTGDNERNADVLAHEMSHLVLNRFFARPAPLWLNEGLAEWYQTLGWKAFKGQRASPKDGLGNLPNAYSAPALLSLSSYPAANEVHRFYASCRQLVGFLQLEKDPATFVAFLQAVTGKGSDAMAAISELYGFAGQDALQAAFTKFLR